MGPYYTSGDDAPLVGVTPLRVKQLIKAGVLPATRTIGGVYLIEEKDLERLLRQRAAALEARVARR